MKTIVGLCAALVVSVATAGAARAQMTQTWVSGVGDDANPCTRTAPCLTFAGALVNTAAGGEIDVLDPGDFGPITIVGSLTINGHAGAGWNGNAGATFGASSGIVVAAGPTDVVTLRGLSIEGSGTGSGVSVTSAGFVELEDSWIYGFVDGVSFQPTAGGQLWVSGVVSKDNSGAGIVAGSTGGTAFVTVNDARFENDAIGVRAIAGAKIGVYDSDASHNATAGVSAELDAGGGATEINLESVAASENDVGVRAMATAGTAIVRMSKVLGTANVTAPVTWSGGGSVLSFGNNRLDLVPALALTSPAASQMVTAGASAMYTIDVGVTGLLSAPIGFACSGLPAGASCTFSPTTLPVGTTSGSVMLTIATTAADGTGGFLRSGGEGVGMPPIVVVPLFAVALAMVMAMLLGTGRRGWRRGMGAAAGVLLLMGVVVGVAACGSSGATGGQDMATAGGGADGGDDLGGDLGSGGDMEADMGTAVTPTPKGTYNVTVTGTSGTLTGTMPLTLVVQ